MRGVNLKRSVVRGGMCLRCRGVRLRSNAPTSGHGWRRAAAVWPIPTIHGDNTLIALRLFLSPAVDVDTPEKRAELNSTRMGRRPWTRSVEQPNGDTHTVYFYRLRRLAQDRRNSTWAIRGRPTGASAMAFRPGLGWTAFIVQRPDIASGGRFPAYCRCSRCATRKSSLIATFIPTLNGGVNHGSVLYVFGTDRPAVAAR